MKALAENVFTGASQASVFSADRGNIGFGYFVCEPMANIEYALGELDRADELGLLCSSCTRPLIDPVVHKCNNMMCKKCSVKHSTCPVCLKPVEGFIRDQTDLQVKAWLDHLMARPRFLQFPQAKRCYSS